MNAATDPTTLDPHVARTDTALSRPTDGVG